MVIDHSMDVMHFGSTRLLVYQNEKVELHNTDWL